MLEVSSKELVRVVTPSENVTEFGVENIIQSGNTSTPTTFIRTISESRGDFYQVLNSTFSPGKELSPFVYNPGNNMTLPKVTKIVDNTMTVPYVASFAGSSSYNNPVSTEGYGYWNINRSYMTFAAANQITEVGSDYDTSTSILVSSTDWVEEITYSLKTGNRWFITLIKNFVFPIVGEDINATNRYTGIQNGSELNKLGVFEILGITQSGDVRLHLDTKGLPNSIVTLGTWDQFVEGLGSLGFLIWKSRSDYKGEMLTVSDSTRGVSAGAFYSKYPTDTVRQDFASITKEYGSNPP